MCRSIINIYFEIGIVYFRLFCKDHKVTDIWYHIHPLMEERMTKKQTVQECHSHQIKWAILLSVLTDMRKQTLNQRSICSESDIIFISIFNLVLYQYLRGIILNFKLTHSNIFLSISLENFLCLFLFFCK